jgi:phosphoribosylamine--glycine ligase
MIDKQGNPKVIEFNCRFGDPETQPIMLRMKSDLVDLCLAACDGKLNEKTSEWDERASLGVVIAAVAIRATTAPVMRSTACRWKKRLTARSSTPVPDSADDDRVLTSGGRCSALPRWVTPSLKRKARLRPDERYPLGRQL